MPGLQPADFYAKNVKKRFVLYKDFTVGLSLRYNLTFSKVERATQNYMLP